MLTACHCCPLTTKTWVNAGLTGYRWKDFPKLEMIPAYLTAHSVVLFAQIKVWCWVWSLVGNLLHPHKVTSPICLLSSRTRCSIQTKLDSFNGPFGMNCLYLIRSKQIQFLSNRSRLYILIPLLSKQLCWKMWTYWVMLTDITQQFLTIQFKFVKVTPLEVDMVQS